MSIPRIEARPSYGPLRFLRNTYIGIEGPRGGSKTRSLLTELVCRSLEYPGSRTILARHDRTDLTKTVLHTFETQVLPAFGLKAPGNQSAENRAVYDMPNGSQFIPLGLRELSKAQSFEATWAYVNEAGECNKRQVTELVATLRHLKSAERSTLPDWNGLIFDINPIDPNSWPNKFMESVDDSLRDTIPGTDGIQSREQYARMQAHNWKQTGKKIVKRIISKHMDNPGYWDFENWCWTPLGQTYVAETLGMYVGYQRERWVNGRWVGAEGSVFPEFNDRVNVCNPFPAGIPHNWPIFLLIDPGYFHPCGVSWNTIAPNGCRYTIDEIKLTGVPLEDLVRMIKARKWGVSRVLIDPAGTQKRQESPISFQRQLEALGINADIWKYAAKEDHDASVTAHRQAIISGMYKICSNCVETIAEHQSWRFKTVRNGEPTVGDDQYEDKNNDLIDGLLGLERTERSFEQPKVEVKSPPHLPSTVRQEKI